jgi:hypothetical protein
VRGRKRMMLAPIPRTTSAATRNSTRTLYPEQSVVGPADERRS